MPFLAGLENFDDSEKSMARIRGEKLRSQDSDRD
jgi:hypothetical protein